MIRKNASVAFEMDCQNALQHGETACTHSYYYASVLGEGKAEILEGDEKCKGLSALMLHMAGRNDVFTAEMADKVAVIAIRVDALTAKKASSSPAVSQILHFPILRHSTRTQCAVRLKLHKTSYYSGNAAAKPLPAQ